MYIQACAHATTPAPTTPCADTTHRLPQTALKPKVRLESMALMKPVQLKDSSPAEASATPNMMGTRLSITGRGVASPRMTLKSAAHDKGSRGSTHSGVRAEDF